jgi:hypothetical protein
MKVIKASKFVVTLLVILFTVSLSSCSFRTTTHRSNYKADSARTRKKKLMEIKVLNTMHQAILKIKDSESESVFYLL